MASETDSIHSTPSLRAQPSKTSADTHFSLDEAAPAREQLSPPPFSSGAPPPLYLVTESTAVEPLAALVSNLVSPLQLAQEAAAAAASSATSSSLAVAESETKAALPRDTKDGQASKDLDDGEPPPPYTEGSSPLDGFQYVMAAAGSIITQVQQGGPAPLNTALGGMLSGALLCMSVH